MRGHYSYHGPYPHNPYLGQEAAEPSPGQNGQGGLLRNLLPGGEGPQRSITYREAYQQLQQFMQQLEANGVTKKEIVALLIWYGINEAGALAGAPNPGAPNPGAPNPGAPNPDVGRWR